MKKILLVNPSENSSSKKHEAYPSGALLLIGTMLTERGHHVSIIHMTGEGQTIEGLERRIVDMQPDIVGITMNTFQTVSARRISESVKKINPKTLVVTGGPHPSALKTEILTDFPHIDVAVIGEGEHTFMEIVADADLHTLAGICYEGRENAARPYAENLDYLPLPDLSLVNMRMFAGADPVGAYPSMFIMASRGCPFQCTFCNKSIWGGKVRLRKPELVVREIEWLHSRYGIREIFFQDDTFNLRRQWTEEICHRIMEKGLHKKMVFKTPFRANKELVDEALLGLMKAAGFWLIFYGVENGNQQMLDAMGKGLKIEDIKRAFRLTHAAGIKTIGSFIVGMPGETEETVNDSIALFNEIRPYVTGCAAAMPFPKTVFEQEVIKRGHRLISDYDQYAMGKILVRTDALDPEQLKKAFERFRKIIIKRFFIDLLQLRYARMLLFSLRSPWYISHMVYRITSYLAGDK
ncbi:MAG: radical SAM protein [Endomicrobiales bacterium]